MSVRSLSKIWLHLIWGTHNHEKILVDKELRKNISRHLLEYSKEKGIYMKINFVNADHVHTLIELPVEKPVAEVVKFLKGESSFWINKNVDLKFSWAMGYAAFSISESGLEKVIKYISNQEEHHKAKSFIDEYKKFLDAYKISEVENR
ncbi:MAG: transposase [Ignavibacteria bacterium]|nr:transposase [Ignavibacteria bacterium]